MGTMQNLENMECSKNTKGLHGILKNLVSCGLPNNLDLNLGQGDSKQGGYETTKFVRVALICAMAWMSLSDLGVKAQAAIFDLDGSHMEVGFSVKHLMISNVKGRFDKVTGQFDFDSKTKEIKDVSIDIDPSTVNTNEADRDKHLRGADFFNVEKFPKITFKADKGSIKKVNGSLPGKLTILDKTKDVVLDIRFNGETEFMGKKRVSFSGTTKINRKDFGLTWNKNLDKGGVAVGDEVQITLEGEGVIKEAAAADTAPKKTK